MVVKNVYLYRDRDYVTQTINNVEQRRQQTFCHLGRYF